MGKAAVNVVSGERDVPSICRLAVGAETESATPLVGKELRSVKTGSGDWTRTNRPTEGPSSTYAAIDTQNCANSTHSSALPNSPVSASEKNQDTPEHTGSTSARAKRDTSVPEDPAPYLARVLEAWPGLPAAMKARILALVDAAQAG